MSPLNDLLAIMQLRQAESGRPMARGGTPRQGALSVLAPRRQQPNQLVQGPGGGQDDIVQTMLAPGEYVWDADTVSAIGDGDNKEGARRLDELRERIRAHKRSAPASKIPPKTKPLTSYMNKGAI